MFRLTGAMARALRAVQALQPAAATRIIQDALNGSSTENSGRRSAFTVDGLIGAGSGDPIKGRAAQTAPRIDSTVGRQKASSRSRSSERSSGSFGKRTYSCKAGSRDYLIYLPPTATPRGVLVMLHGCKQQAEEFSTGTGMNDIASREDLIVLYPMQTTNENPSGCWNWFRTQDQERIGGEAEIIAGLTAEVVDQYRIPPSRVFAAGLSAGGAMAVVLGAAYPDLFTAIGVHSGLPYRAASDVNSAFAAMRTGAARRVQQRFLPRLIVLHGTNDRTVVPANADELWSDAVAAHDAGTVLTRERKDNGRDVSQHILLTDKGDVVAEKWMIHGLHHGWSGGNPQGSFMDPLGPNASQEIMRFMLNTTDAR